MTQFVAYYLRHPASLGFSMAAGEDRRAVKATAKRRLRSLGIATGRLALRRRDDLDADAFGDLCAMLARAFPEANL